MNTRVERSDSPVSLRKPDVVLRRGRVWTLITFSPFALATLLAIWTLSWFVVQDGPLYLYNSHIMLESFKASSPFDQYFVQEWKPLPYWGAYALLMALMPVLPAHVADQVLMTLTSVGISAMLIWLRVRVAGWQGGAVVAPLSFVLSINVIWLYGLHSFLLGALLYVVTLGWWWRVRDGMGARHSAVLAVLLVAGYLCHLVSFGLTVVSIGVLALFTPGPGVGRRLKWSVIGAVPSLPLVVLYLRMMGAEGEAGMQWTGITNLFSATEWLTYVFMADFPTIHNNGAAVPGGWFIQFLFTLPPPSRLALIALFLVTAATVLRRSDEDRMFLRAHRGWVVLAAVLLGGGAFGPSDIGAAHGFLRERVLLLGFASLIPVLRVKPGHVLTRAGMGLMIMAAIVQLGLLWDYGLKSDRMVDELMRARPHVGTGKRLAAVMVNTEWEYRTSPVVHAPNLLGIGTGNLIWNNYGPALYYFPIEYRSSDAKVLSLFIGNRTPFYQFGNPEAGETGLSEYTKMLERHHREIDVLLTWTSTPELDAVNRQWFAIQPLHESARVKVLEHR